MAARAGGAWRPLGGVGTCMGSCGRVVCRGGTGCIRALKRHLLHVEGGLLGQEWWPGQGLGWRGLGGPQWTTR